MLFGLSETHWLQTDQAKLAMRELQPYSGHDDENAAYKEGGDYAVKRSRESTDWMGSTWTKEDNNLFNKEADFKFCKSL